MSEEGIDHSNPGPMAPEPDLNASSASPQEGVLDNLPRARPAVRSPRRRNSPGPNPAAAASAGRVGQESRPAAEGSSAPDLEAIARSGLAAAGGAASLGLRLAGRAAAVVRDAVERR